MRRFSGVRTLGRETTELAGGRSRGSRAMRKQNMQEVSKEIALGLWSIGYGEFSHVRVSFFLFFFFGIERLCGEINEG